MAARFDPERMYSYIKGWAMGRRMPDTLSALSFARKLHKDQKRKDGQPYIVHPLTMACHAIALEMFTDDAIADQIIAACLLHDVVEDCDAKVTELPVSSATQDAVRRLTHVKPDPLDTYYRQIRESQVASVVKLLDRCDNVSTMAGVFSAEKTLSYIKETRDYVLPLIRHVKGGWPVFSNALFIVKYHILSVIDGLEACLQLTEEAGIKDKEPSFTAFLYEEDMETPIESDTHDNAEDAVIFAITHGWDEVVNDNTGEVILRKPKGQAL